MKFLSSLFFLWILNIHHKTITATGEFSALALVHEGGATFDLVDNVTTKTGEPFKVIVLVCPIEEEDLKGKSEKNAVSKFGRSLKVQQIYTELSEITSDKICKNQVEPGILYKESTKNFSFGYRIYVNDDQIQFISYLIKNAKGGLPSELTKGYYGRLRRTNVPNIYWYIVTQINILPNKAIITGHRIDKRDHDQKVELEKCENYNFGKNLFKNEKIAEIYKEEYQNSVLKQFKNPTSSEIETDHMYLVEQQLTPIDDFDSLRERIVTCSYLNVGPMWATIANGWWKEVELIIKNIADLTPMAVSTGTYGTLMLPDSANPNEIKEVLLKDTIVPEVYWKLVKYYDNNVEKTQLIRQGMVVITYNYVSKSVPHTPLCVESICKKSGWENIENDDYKTGLTYCCSPNKNLLKKLGLEGIPKFDDLILETVPLEDEVRDEKEATETHQKNS